MAINLLYVHYGEEWIRGSERCLLDLLAHLDRAQYRPVVWSNSRTLLSTVKALEVETEYSPFTLLGGWETPRMDIRASWRLYQEGCRLLQKHQITLVHCNSGAPCQWMVPAARTAGVPLLAHLHARYQARDRYSLLLHQVSLAIGVSQPVIAGLLADGMPAHRCRVIPNGIDAARLAAHPAIDIRARFAIAPEQLMLLSVGSLIRRKGMDLLIDAVAQLQGNGLSVALVIVGAGEEQAALADQIARLHLQQQVFLAGEDGQAGSWLQGGADVFISGAREEVFGLVLAEAGWAGLPVIAPDVGGIAEVVLDHDSGLLVPADDVQALADKIRELHENPGLREQLGRQGQARVRAQFSVQRYVADISAAYQDLLRTPKSALHWRDGWRCAGSCLRWLGERVQQRLGRKPA